MRSQLDLPLSIVSWPGVTTNKDASIRWELRLGARPLASIVLADNVDPRVAIRNLLRNFLSHEPVGEPLLYDGPERRIHETV